MALFKVGIREFREKLANYLLQSDKPVSVCQLGLAPFDHLIWPHPSY